MSDERNVMRFVVMMTAKKDLTSDVIPIESHEITFPNLLTAYQENAHHRNHLQYYILEVKWDILYEDRV